MHPPGDTELIRIIDVALEDATRRSGAWLACRPGCNQCCSGVFRISQLDAARLRTGMSVLQCSDPALANNLALRIEKTRAGLSADFPGDAGTGLLGEDSAALEAFESFAEDSVCPVLDPSTGTCTLYAHRPMTCRTFGPPVWTNEGGLAVCELCFVGASADEVEKAQLKLPPQQLEDDLTLQTDASGETVVAFAFRESQSNPNR